MARNSPLPASGVARAIVGQLHAHRSGPSTSRKVRFQPLLSISDAFRGSSLRVRLINTLESPERDGSLVAPVEHVLPVVQDAIDLVLVGCRAGFSNGGDEIAHR